MCMNDFERGLAAGVTFAVTDAGATEPAAALASGQVFVVTASAATHILMDTFGTPAAATTDFLLNTGEILEIRTNATRNTVSGRSPAGGSGNVYIAQRSTTD